MPSPRFANFKDDDRSVVEAVRVAMISHPKNREDGARDVGIGQHTYSFIVKLIEIKSDRRHERHWPKIDAALSAIDKNRNALEARLITADFSDLFKRRVGKSRGEIRKTAKQNKRLDQALISIRESCETTSDMEIPRYLSQREALKAVATLAASSVLIGRFIGRLLGKGEDSDHE